MNNYPEWWNTTITVYNKYEDLSSRIVTWHRTVLHNCFWKYTGNKIVVGETALETNTTLCRIPESPAFLEPVEWDEEDKSKYFTLRPGDIIVSREVEDVIDEYTSGYRSSDFLAKYKKLRGCITIEQCATNTGPGRDLPHYYVRGV